MPKSANKNTHQEAHHAHPHHAHPHHAAELPRVRRIRGQIDGIERMIEEGRYCVDILMQVKAARAALQALESAVLKSHLEACVKSALEAKDSFEAGKKIAEITELLGR